MTESKSLLDLEEVLGEPNIDYWSDEGITIAEGIIDGLNISERDALTRLAPTKSAIWKEHLSNCLRHYRELWATRLLSEFVFDANLDVALAAADALRTHLPLPLTDHARLLRRAEDLLRQARPVYVPGLNALIDGLSPSGSRTPPLYRGNE